MKSPVLLIAFCRPETTKQVFESISQSKPPKLYVFIDGPRENSSEDIEKQKQIISIFDNIDWDCKLTVLKHESNLGCSKGPYEAIKWFFKYEEEGIILEDDIVPIGDFYIYCDNMLELYRENESIQAVSGWSYFYDGYPRSYPYSYYYSRINSSWGWATWRKSWDKMDLTLKSIKRDDFISKLKSFNFPSRTNTYYIKLFDKISEQYDVLKSWDYQFLFCSWMQNKLFIQPMKSMTKNIGVGGGSTHEFSSKLSNYITQSIYPIHHPKIICDSIKLDLIRIKNEYLLSPSIIKILHVKLGLIKRAILCIMSREKKSKIKKIH